MHDSGRCSLVIADHRQRECAINVQTLLQRLCGIVITTDQHCAAARTWITFGMCMKRCAVGRSAFQTGDTFEDSVTDSLVGKFE